MFFLPFSIRQRRWLLEDKMMKVLLVALFVLLSLCHSVDAQKKAAFNCGSFSATGTCDAPTTACNGLNITVSPGVTEEPWPSIKFINKGRLNFTFTVSKNSPITAITAITAMDDEGTQLQRIAPTIAFTKTVRSASLRVAIDITKKYNMFQYSPTASGLISVTARNKKGDTCTFSEYIYVAKNAKSLSSSKKNKK